MAIIDMVLDGPDEAGASIRGGVWQKVQDDLGPVFHPKNCFSHIFSLLEVGPGVVGRTSSVPEDPAEVRVDQVVFNFGAERDDRVALTQLLLGVQEVLEVGLLGSSVLGLGQAELLVEVLASVLAEVVGVVQLLGFHFAHWVSVVVEPVAQLEVKFTFNGQVVGR